MIKVKKWHWWNPLFDGSLYEVSIAGQIEQLHKEVSNLTSLLSRSVGCPIPKNERHELNEEGQNHSDNPKDVENCFCQKVYDLKHFSRPCCCLCCCEKSHRTAQGQGAQPEKAVSDA